jgi:hypothetical protein
MKKKQIKFIVEFDNKRIEYPVDFEDAKDKDIAKKIACNLILSVDMFRKERIDKLKVYRSVKND